MAVSSSLSILLANPVPKISSNQIDTARTRVLSQRTLNLYKNLGTRHRLTRLAAGLTRIEPDLNEDPVDRWATPGVDGEDFKYGEWDGHHTYFEGQEEGTFWELIAKDIEAAEPPTGFQGVISWLFLPVIFSGIFFHVPMHYLFVAAGLFTIVFCIIEMDKPDKPHNFEPQIYNMERGARDKLINDYNTMPIWDFNEKYGHLWDFTIIREDTTKR